MEGSRPPDGVGCVTRGGPAGGTVMLDDICLDRRYMNGQRTVPKAEQRLDRHLEYVVEGEIIPRLMLLHKQETSKPKRARVKRQIDVSAHVDEFANFVIKHETDVVVAYVKVLLQKGLDLETLLLQLLAPTARKLGEMWEADTIDFVDVTIGTARLQQILHHFTFPLEKGGVEPRRRVLLLPTPNEQHTFGLLMVSKFFRREGWQVWSGTPLSVEELQAVVAEQWFAVIGFSLSCDRLIGDLCSIIQMVRRVSRNQSVQIIVGGRICTENAAFKSCVGADLVVADAREALDLAESVLRDEIGRQC